MIRTSLGGLELPARCSKNGTRDAAGWHWMGLNPLGFATGHTVPATVPCLVWHLPIAYNTTGCPCLKSELLGSILLPIRFSDVSRRLELFLVDMCSHGALVDTCRPRE